jgi:ATP-dependent DNA helicase RecG
VLQRIANNCAEGKQAYWVCTLVEQSETLDAQAAEATYQEIQQRFPELKIGLVHGKMKADDKQRVMQQFKDNQLQLLIATTVIEVGVDVPNASLMIIENAERLGLSQLHQLRGRVGRGALASFCVLLYKTPLSKNGHERLSILRESNDGFVIAEKDLELRGPGEMLGPDKQVIWVFGWPNWSAMIICSTKPMMWRSKSCKSIRNWLNPC